MEKKEADSYQKIDGEGGAETTVHPVLVIGKKGNGKSTLCNALLGNNSFPVGNGTAPQTKTANCATTRYDKVDIKVIDTPDITSLNLDSDQMKAEVEKWREMTSPRPAVVILTVRCDVTYTAEEWGVYKEVSGLWGDNSLGRLLVAFTFGGVKDVAIDDELRSGSPELQSVLRDADWAYFVFDSTNEESRKAAVQKVLHFIQEEETTPRSGPAKTVSGYYRPSRLVATLTVVAVLASLACIASLVLESMAASVVFVACVMALLLVIVVLVCCRRKKQGQLLPK